MDIVNTLMCVFIFYVIYITRDSVVELVHCGSQDQIKVLTKPHKVEAFFKLLKLREEHGLCTQ